MMQIFILDYNNQLNAQYYMDKHIIKIPIEATQILSTAIRLQYSDYISDDNILYKATHIKHPWVLYATKSQANQREIYYVAKALFKEYTHRYNKIHKSETVLEECRDWFNIDKSIADPFPIVMPDKYKTSNIIESYRNYYMAEKRNIAAWKNREVPDWWK